MATRTIADGGGNWDAVGSWVEGVVPTTGDDVVATATSGSLAVNVATANLASFDLSLYTGTLSGSSTITVAPTAGTNTVSINGTITWTGALNLKPSSSATINFTSGGKSLQVNTSSGAGTVQQQDNLTLTNSTTSPFTISGTWVANSHNITLSGGGWTNSGTFTAGTGTVTFTAASCKILGTKNNNFYNLTVTTPSSATTSGSGFLNIQSSQTITGTLTLNGYNDSTGRLLVQSNTYGTQVTITVPTTSSATYSNLDLQDINLACSGGTIDLSAITGLSGDCGGNANVTFTTAQTNYIISNSTTTNWSSLPWSLGRLPLPQDTAKAYSAVTAALHMNVVRFGTMDFSLVPPGSAMGFSSLVGTLSCYGSMLLSSGVTGIGGAWNFLGRNASYSISLAGASSNQLSFQPRNATYTLGGNLSATGFSVSGDSSSTFNDGGYSVVTPSLSQLSCGTVTLSGNWQLTGSGTVWATPSVTTFSMTGTLSLTDSTASTKTFNGGGKTYGNILLSGSGTGQYTFTGSNTFNDFRDINAQAHTIQFAAGTTTTVTTWGVSGSSSTNLITLKSSTTSAFTLSGPAGTTFNASNLSISHSTAAGASWYAGATPPSVDGGGNTGWTFTAAPNATKYSVSGPPFGTYKSASALFYYEPEGPVASDTVVTPTSTGTGTFSPATLTWTAGTGGPKSVTYTPTTCASSPHGIAGTNTGGLTDPSAINYTVKTIALTVFATANAKRYDGTNTASAAPTVFGSLASGDTATYSETYDNATAGYQKTLTPAASISDGNSGNNYTVSTVTLTTGVILPAADTPAAPVMNWPQKMSDWLSVKDYGAVGDGITDDTTAIQNCINAALGVPTYPLLNSGIYFPTGTYLITSSLNLTGGGNQNSYGFLIVGCGASSTILWGGATADSMLVIAHSSYATVDGIVFDGNNVAGVGLDFFSAAFQTSMLVKNCVFQNCTSVGLYFRENGAATADSGVWNCKLLNNANGIVFFGGNVLVTYVDHCYFSGHTVSAIKATSGNYFVRNSHFELNAVDLDNSSANLGISIRTVTSQGSGLFLKSTGVSTDTQIQDVWIDGWTTWPCINANQQPVTMFDCKFTNPPTSEPPIYLPSNKLLYSNITSAATRATIVNFNGTEYQAPDGNYGGTVTGADQTFYPVTVLIPTKVYDAIVDFGAAGNGTTDDTVALRNTISAAQSWASSNGVGAWAYIPSGSYKITGTLEVTGDNYVISGGLAGRHCFINWSGSSSGTVTTHSAMWAHDTHNVTIQCLTFFNGKPQRDIYVNTSSPMTLCLDRIWPNGSQTGSNANGIYFDSLSTGSMVLIKWVEGNVWIHDCGTAKIIYKRCGICILTVDGTGDCTVGNLGVLVYDDGTSTSSWVINDGQSLVASEHYVEQIPSTGTCMSISGSKSNTIITLSDMKQDGHAGGVYLSMTNATDFSPQISFVGTNSDTNCLPYNITNSGGGSVNYVQMAGYYPIYPKTLTGTVNAYAIANVGITDTTWDATAQTYVSNALDHLRLLRMLDAAISDPLDPFVPQPETRILRTWRLRGHGNLLRI